LALAEAIEIRPSVSKPQERDGSKLYAKSNTAAKIRGDQHRKKQLYGGKDCCLDENYSRGVVEFQLWRQGMKLALGSDRK